MATLTVHVLSCSLFDSDTSHDPTHLPQPFSTTRSQYSCHVRFSAMASQQPPEEGSDTSFWASVFTEPPNVLCGVLTDLNLHRFTLHQHLTTNEALTETPLLHQPFQQALPPALQRHIHHYNTNLNLANVHLRRALDALDYLGRHPPSVYLRNPDTATDDQPLPTTTEAPFPTPSGLQPGEPVRLPPAIRHYLLTFQPGTLVLQHNSTQTTPTRFTTHRAQQTDSILEPLTFHEAQQTTPRPEHCHTSTQTDSVVTPPTLHEAQQTTPRPDNCHTYIQTDIHAIVRYPAFATPKTASQATTSPQPSTPPQSTPAPSTTATITSAANKQPNPDQWLHADLIPENPPSPALPSDFTAPIGGTPHRARSKTPPRSTTPQRTHFTQGRHSDPRHGSPVPQPRSTTSIPTQRPMHPPPTTFGQPKRPPPPLPEQHSANISPNWYPTAPPPVQAPYPSTAPPTTYNQVTHAWPAPYQPQQFPQQCHSPPLYQQPIFRGEPPQLQQPYSTPPMASSEPVRILFDSNGRPLPPAQQPYFPEDDPWNNYGN